MGTKALTHLRRHAVGYLALFVALSGVAYAATAPRNSVKSSSIKNGQVKTKDLGNKAVAAAKLKDAAVTGAKLGDGAVTEAKLADGAVTDDKLGVPLDFVPAANVASVKFSATNCALPADPGCTAHPQIPFKAADFDLQIECTDNGGNGVALHMAILKPGGRATGQTIQGTTVFNPDHAVSGNSAIINSGNAFHPGPTGAAAGSFISTFETPDQQHTVSLTGNYTIDSIGVNGACTVDGVAVGA